MRKQREDFIQEHFSKEQWATVREELLSIKEEHTMNGEYNLFNARMSALTIAKGDVGELKILVEQAKIDFRDVVMTAMYLK